MPWRALNATALAGWAGAHCGAGSWPHLGCQNPGTTEPAEILPARLASSLEGETRARRLWLLQDRSCQLGHLCSSNLTCSPWPCFRLGLCSALLSSWTWLIYSANVFLFIYFFPLHSCRSTRDFISKKSAVPGFQLELLLLAGWLLCTENVLGKARLNNFSSLSVFIHTSCQQRDDLNKTKHAKNRPGHVSVPHSLLLWLPLNLAESYWDLLSAAMVLVLSPLLHVEVMESRTESSSALSFLPIVSESALSLCLCFVGQPLLLLPDNFVNDFSADKAWKNTDSWQPNFFIYIA